MDFSWETFTSLNVSRISAQTMQDGDEKHTEIINVQQIFAEKGDLFCYYWPWFHFVKTSNLDPIRALYAFIDFFVLLFGVPLNALLIYMIKTKTSPEMQRYSQLLIISCIIDLFVAGWTSIVQPVCLFP